MIQRGSVYEGLGLRDVTYLVEISEGNPCLDGISVAVVVGVKIHSARALVIVMY